MTLFLRRSIVGIIAGWLTFIAANWSNGGFYQGYDKTTLAVVGIGVAICFVILGWIIGLLLCIPRLNTAWNQMGFAAAGMVTLGFIALVFAHPLGLTHPWIDPDDESLLHVMNRGVAVLAYTAVILPIVNWPRKRDEN